MQTLSEFIKTHTIKEELVTITPQMAERILSTNYTNRPIKRELVEKYKKAMLAGKWKVHKPGIELTYDGKLINGQHRLTAIIESDCSVEMWLVTTDAKTNKRPVFQDN